MQVLSLVFTLLLAPVADAKPFLPHLAEGRPGCFELIRNQSLSPRQVKSLPVDCQNLRSDYFEALRQVGTDPEVFSKNLNQFLSQSKTPRAPYEAILFATLLNHKSIQSGIAARAKAEKKMKVPFQYAALANELLQGKECMDLGKTYQSPEYQELCMSRDRILLSLYTAHSKEKGAKK